MASRVSSRQSAVRNRPTAARGSAALPERIAMARVMTLTIGDGREQGRPARSLGRPLPRQGSRKEDDAQPALNHQRRGGRAKGIFGFNLSKNLPARRSLGGTLRRGPPLGGTGMVKTACSFSFRWLHEPCISPQCINAARRPAGAHFGSYDQDEEPNERSPIHLPHARPVEDLSGRAQGK